MEKQLRHITLSAFRPGLLLEWALESEYFVRKKEIIIDSGREIRSSGNENGSPRFRNLSDKNQRQPSLCHLEPACSFM